MSEIKKSPNPYVLSKVIGKELVKGTNDAYQSKRRHNTKNYDQKILEKMNEIEMRQISLWSYLKYMGAKVGFILIPYKRILFYIFCKYVT